MTDRSAMHEPGVEEPGRDPRRRRVLLAVDGSDAGQRAAARAVELFGPDADYVLLHVAPPPMTTSPSGRLAAPAPEELLEAGYEAAREVLRAEADALAVPVRGVLETGEPATVVCEVADQEDVDVVVVGSRGLGLVKRALLGSVSHAVVNHTSRPVLVVPAP